MKIIRLKYCLLFAMFLLTFEAFTKNKSNLSRDAWISHKVKSGESVYKISKKYGVTVKDIQRVNPSLKNLAQLKPGQLLKVPDKNKYRPLNISKSNSNTNNNKVTKEGKLAVNKKLHTVKKGQNLYVIAKIYHVKVEDLKKWNKISGKNLKVGSKLIVAQATVKPLKLSENKITSPDLVKETSLVPVKKDNSSAEVYLIKNSAVSQKVLSTYFRQSSNAGVEVVKGTGAPMLSSIESVDDVYVVQHKSLPEGTIIRIKNMVNSRMAYAKVVGKLEENMENKYVIIRYSDAVKKLLLLKEGKCYVQVEYIK